MRYTMTWADPLTAEEEAERLEMQEAVNTATNPSAIPDGPEREAARAAWEDAWTAYGRATPHLFYLNTRSMDGVLTIMDRLGMLTEQDHPDLPRPGDFGLTEDDMDDLAGNLAPDEKGGADAKGSGQDDDPLTEARERFKRAQDEVTDAEPQPVTGIPWHKLRSNDGWLVTPTQIGAALAAWEAADEQERQEATGEHDRFPRWIEWMGKAKERGGFRVF